MDPTYNIVSYKQEKSDDLQPFTKRSVLKMDIKYGSKKKERTVFDSKLINSKIAVSLSSFSHHDAVIIANIDAVCNITSIYDKDLNVIESSMEGGYLGPISPNSFSFYDDSPHATYAPYIMYRFDDAYGFASTFEGNKIQKDPIKNTSPLNQFGTDISIDEMNDKIRSAYPEGLDLVVGYLRVDNPRLSMIEQIRKAQMYTKEGGNFVLQVSDIGSVFVRDLIYLCSLVFLSVDIIKPISSDVNSTSCYVVYKGKKKTSTSRFGDALVSLEKDVDTVLSFIGLVEGFEDWYTSKVKSVENYVKAYSYQNIDSYHALALWNIPDNYDTFNYV